MGLPVRTLEQFEHGLRDYHKNWVIIIFANAHSESRAVEYVIRNFNVMDTISDDVDFYLPGYCVSYDKRFETPGEWQNNQLLKLHRDSHIKITREVEQTTCNIFRMLSRRETIESAYSVINNPRLGKIAFFDAEYADFVMEFTRRKKNYFYTGSCELILMPIANRNPDYTAARVFDLDAIVESRASLSIDGFLMRLFNLLRDGAVNNRFGVFGSLFNIRSDVIRQTERLYYEATHARYTEDKYEIIIQNVIRDIEGCIHWSLQQPFYFISYSTRNTMLAELLKREMQGQNKLVWIAPDGIPQGREYSLVIPTTLRLTKTFVLLLTPDSARSHWVKRELDIAISNGERTKVKVLLAEGFAIDDIQRDEELRFYLNRVQVKYYYNDVIENKSLFQQFLEE